MPYRLARQLHFRAQVPGREGDIVVTMQRWDSTGRPGSVCVTLYDGVEQSRRLFSTEDDLAHLQDKLDQVAEQHRTDALSEEGAHDEVAERYRPDALSEEGACDEVSRRGGPGLTWCHRKDCGEPVPWAAATCADGHPTESVGGIEFLSVGQRRPPITVVTGGKK